MGRIGMSFSQMDLWRFLLWRVYVVQCAKRGGRGRGVYEEQLEEYFRPSGHLVNLKRYRED